MNILLLFSRNRILERREFNFTYVFHYNFEIEAIKDFRDFQTEGGTKWQKDSIKIKRIIYTKKKIFRNIKFI